MKIGIDGRLWYETGVGRYIRALTAELGQLDTRNEYVLFLTSRAYASFSPPNNRWHKQLTNVSWHTLYEQFVMPREYARAKVDLIHVPYFAVPFFTPHPFVVTIHDLTVSHMATGKATTKPYPLYLIKRLGYRIILQHAVSGASAVITVSHSVEKQIEKELGVSRAKIVVTKEAGSIEQHESSFRTSVKNYILYVGNAHPHKNLARLVLAFSLLIKKVPELKLVLIGKRDYFYDKLEKFVREKGLFASVIFVGEVTNSDLVNWYTEAKAFVFPSRSEGFGIPGLEAMSLGCPVAASDIPVFREIYQDGAIYFNQQSPTDIERVLLKLLTRSNDARELIEKGTRVAKSYSWKKMAAETLAVYESCYSLRPRQ